MTLPDGQYGVICYYFDSTKLREAEAALRESEERLRFALEACHIGAWDLDLVDHTAFRSLEHDRIFGYTELLPQWTFEMFLQHVLPEDRAEVEAMVRRGDGGAARLEFRVPHPPRGRRGPVDLVLRTPSHRPFRPRRVVGVVQDITERKQAEAELAKHREHLEELVQERTGQLETANEALRESEERCVSGRRKWKP